MKIKLDHVGQLCAAISNKKNPCTFSIGIHLKEFLVPCKLQEAVNDLMERLPHMNVRKYSGFMNYYNQFLDEPLKIEKENNTYPCRFFEKQNQLLRITYGERHFILEVFHSICDGRGLAMMASSLLIRYFEIMGEKPSKKDFIDCMNVACVEEIEDAYVRYADMRKSKSEKGERVYVPKRTSAESQIITQKFDLAELKCKAKGHGVTISEYILAHIFKEFANQRVNDSSNKPIAINVPIDCRRFFKSKSLRNFVSHIIVKMPEVLDFTEVALSIKKQLAEITPDYVQGKISEAERMKKLGEFVPLLIKKRIIRSVGQNISAGCSTDFSNLGLIKLPEGIQNKVEMYTFSLGEVPNTPYQFACVATGNILTLTITTACGTEIADRISKSLLK